MSDDWINLLLTAAGLLALFLIVALPQGWSRILVRHQLPPSVRQPIAEEHSLTCADCARISPHGSRAWKAYLSVGSDLAILCPQCAALESGDVGRLRLPREDDA